MIVHTPSVLKTNMQRLSPSTFFFKLALKNTYEIEIFLKALTLRRLSSKQTVSVSMILCEYKNMY